MNPENLSMRRTVISPSILSVTASRHLQPLVLLLFLFALIAPSPAQQPTQPPTTPLPATPLPATPLPQTPTTPGAISGFIADADDASISSARVTLTSDSQLPSTTTITASDGSFTLTNVPPGPFTLSIDAKGFTARKLPGTLRPSETLILPTVVLTAAGATTDVQVTATQIDIAEAQINEEEHQRVLGIIPNFYVSYIPNPVALDPQQKFELSFWTLVDPVNLVLNGALAGIQQADNTYSWGQGAQAYAKRYAAAYGTFLTGTILGNAVLPILFKQDPRYFYKGTGSVGSRIFYASANAVVCKGDNHRWQVDYSGLLGGLGAAGLANLYYPAINRSGATLIFENTAIGTALSAASNLFQEFLIPKLTPHLPTKPPHNP
jgi:carboxypeptidase family protein